MRKIVALVCVVAGLGLGACKGESKSSSLSIVATTTQMAEFARVVGGEFVHVYGLLPPNAAAHDFAPTPADRDAIKAAKVIVKSGLGLDAWLDAIVQDTGAKAPVVDGSTNVIPREVNGDVDPHYWQNPLYALVAVHNISLMLQRVDPKNASYYSSNEVDYTQKLGELDREVREQLTPLKNRNVVTTHDAFGYYFDHYQLVGVGSVLPTFDSQARPSAQSLAALITKIRQLKVKVIFADQASPSQTANEVAQEAGARVVAGPDSLYGDALGPKGSAAETYIGSIRHNTKVFVTNLA